MKPGDSGVRQLEYATGARLEATVKGVICRTETVFVIRAHAHPLQETSTFQEFSKRRIIRVHRQWGAETIRPGGFERQAV